MNEVDIYISGFSGEVRERLEAMRAAVRELAPQACERICMSMPTLEINGKWFVHFAAFKKHIGFYPQPEGVTAFADKLAGYKTSKGAIQLPLDKPLPLDLIREIIAFRLQDKASEADSLPKEKKSILVPDELSSILASNPEAAEFFESLTDGYKRGYCDWVGGAKQQATRETRAGKALIMLQNKQKTLKT